MSAVLGSAPTLPGGSAAAAGRGGTVPGAAVGRGARAAAAFAVVVALLGLVFARPGTAAGPEVGRLVRGGLEQLVDGTWERVPLERDLADDTVVRTGTLPARFDLPEGAFELAPDSGAVLRAGSVELTAGAVLQEAVGTREVLAAGALARGRGTWRVDLGSSPRVAVYDGTVAVAEQPVGRLRQRALVGGEAGTLTPQRYTAADAWDARLLTEAISVDTVADALGRQLALRYGDEPRPTAFYADFDVLAGALPEALGVLDTQRGGAATRRPGEVLLTAVVADTVAVGAALAPLEAVRETDALRRAGATWGLVLLDRDLGVADLRARLDLALERRAQAVAERGGETPAVPSVPAPSAPTPLTPPAPSPTPAPSSSPTPPAPSAPPPSPEPSPGVVDGLVDDVVDLLDGILPGLSPLSPPSSDDGGGLLGPLLGGDVPGS